MNVQRLMDENARETKILEENMPYYHFAYRQSHMVSSGIETGNVTLWDNLK
jgi:hypothetical protein